MAGGIAEAVDFFPLNVASGPEFLLIFAVIGVVGVAVGKLAGQVVASMGDAAPPSEPSTRRDAGSVYHQRYTRGFFPRPDELEGVAYLKNGRAGVRDMLIADAVARNVVYKPTGAPLDRMLVLGRLPADAPPLQRDFHAGLTRGGLSYEVVRRVAEATAARHEPRIIAELTRAGLYRTGVASARLTYFLVVLAVAALGVLRVLRGVELHRPVGFLEVEIVALVYAASRFSKFSLRSDRGTAYLDWLEASTGSVRGEVTTGRSRSPAIVGIAMIPGLPEFLPMRAPSGLLGSIGSSDSCGSSSSCSSSCSSSSSCGSSSSCSSSSCGGGGGCGG
jgi:uncharacterized protein (TIGR04222 family)